MLLIESLVFRKLTDADYFNINKPPGMEEGGGGQSYIDISTSGVTPSNWEDFFKGVPKSIETTGPKWEVPIRSLGVDSGVQNVFIGQRRKTSVSIRRQKLDSRESNRIYAWKPNLTGFPEPSDPSVREPIENLCVYIAKLSDGDFWAGWFQKSEPESDWPTNESINKMFLDEEGYIKFSGDVYFDVSTPKWPFKLSSTTTIIEDEDDVGEDILFNEDEISPEGIPPTVVETIRRVRKRNTKAVKKLKTLYEGKCQISGEKFTFKKRNGDLYSEGHHLIPLGKGGADSIYNIVVLSPLIHRMFHYAEVEEFDLNDIKDNKLTIIINEDDYTITWHPEHAKIVMSAA